MVQGLPAEFYAADNPTAHARGLVNVQVPLPPPECPHSPFAPTHPLPPLPFTAIPPPIATDLYHALPSPLPFISLCHCLSFPFATALRHCLSPPFRRHSFPFATALYHCLYHCLSLTCRCHCLYHCPSLTCSCLCLCLRLRHRRCLRLCHSHSLSLMQAVNSSPQFSVLSSSPVQQKLVSAQLHVFPDRTCCRRRRELDQHHHSGPARYRQSLHGRVHESVLALCAVHSLCPVCCPAPPAPLPCAVHRLCPCRLCAAHRLRGEDTAFALCFPTTFAANTLPSCCAFHRLRGEDTAFPCGCPQAISWPTKRSLTPSSAR